MVGALCLDKFYSSSDLREPHAVVSLKFFQFMQHNKSQQMPFTCNFTLSIYECELKTSVHLQPSYLSAYTV